jgi:hypothetical protein
MRGLPALGPALRCKLGIARERAIFRSDGPPTLLARFRGKVLILGKAAPFAGTLFPPMLAIARRFSRSIDANPRLLFGFALFNVNESLAR